MNIPMPVQLMEANPKVEETKNQIAVKRGPLVYCTESADLPENISVNQIVLDKASSMEPEMLKIEGRNVLVLKATASGKEMDWNKKLYRRISEPTDSFDIRLIPYYVWGNRGQGEMSVWLSH